MVGVQEDHRTYTVFAHRRERCIEPSQVCRGLVYGELPHGISRRPRVTPCSASMRATSSGDSLGRLRHDDSYAVDETRRRYRLLIDPPAVKVVVMKAKRREIRRVCVSAAQPVNIGAGGRVRVGLHATHAVNSAAIDAQVVRVDSSSKQPGVSPRSRDSTDPRIPRMPRLLDAPPPREVGGGKEANKSDYRMVGGSEHLR